MSKAFMVWMAMGFLSLASAEASEAVYPSTPVGAIEVKDIPSVKAMAASAEGTYFEHYDKAFWKLARYLRRHDVTMSVPVEAYTDERSEMRFLLGSRDVARDLPSTNGVSIVTRPPQTVASIGLKGSYRQSLYDEGVSRLRAWLKDNPDWVEAGAPYKAYWDGPLVPMFMKRSEVHIPVKPASRETAGPTPDREPSS